MAVNPHKLRLVTDPRVRKGDAGSAGTAPTLHSTTMAPQKSVGQTLLEKADKKAASSGGWFSSNNAKWEEAGDLYQQAANAFKIDKLFKEAGDAHAREAECRENCKEINDAANAWWNAAKAYKRGYPDCGCSSTVVVIAPAETRIVAITALSHTVTFLTQAGRFRQAADREKEIAQIHIQEKQDLAKGCESYERAGEWYAQEDANAYVSIGAIICRCSHPPSIGRQTLASRMLPISTPS